MKKIMALLLSALMLVSFAACSGNKSNGEKGFYGAIVSIIRILAYCFTALISTVCLLNLWHSVKGRAV
ncbi:MAG: hypothetical protein IIY93_12885 [Clostridia bacterium]|nr:hypothetical protein [Clostridia bacterium]